MVDQDPGSDILRAVSDLGGTIDSIEEITRLRGPGKLNACFRVQLKDGRTVKGRRFRPVGKRECVTALYPALQGLPFSRLLAVHGSATIEEWVHGAPVEPGRISDEQIHNLTTILGSLHCRRVPRDFSPNKVRDVDWVLRRLRIQLAELESEGHIDSHNVTKLINLAMNNTPPGLEIGIIHTDFHPLNMIMKQDDEIWIIDNEGICLGALDFDIARCWLHWPMTRQQRNIFCNTYREFRSLDPFLAHQRFWSICTLVSTTRTHVRFRQPSQGLLKKLNRTVQNVGEGLWPELVLNDPELVLND